MRSIKERPGCLLKKDVFHESLQRLVKLHLGADTEIEDSIPLTFRILLFLKYFFQVKWLEQFFA